MDFRKAINKVRRSVAQRVAQGEREIAKHFAGAMKEIILLLESYFRKYERGGVLSMDEMNRYNRLNDMFKEFDGILKARYSAAYDSIYAALGFTYAQHWNLTAWQIETAAAANLGYSTASKLQIEAAINGAYAFVPLSETIEHQRAVAAYNFKREVRTALQKGETYKTLADRVEPLLTGGRERAIATARTEAHRVQEQGGLHAAQKADEIGIVMVKQWNSSRDERVRHTKKANHRKLDGVQIPVTEDFKGISGSGPAPGQMGSASEDINCRCFLTYEVVKLDPGKYNKQEEQAFDAWEKLKRAS